MYTPLFTFSVSLSWFHAAHGAARAVRQPGREEDGLRVDRVLPNRGPKEAGPRVVRVVGEAAGLLLPAQQVRSRLTFGCMLP